ncbi:MFS transporter [Cohnella suwonensis]|uniref:MFS transporter n=1 Tax=Cohnella suwonensis TaxID=696072 RepID=A0ABW0LWQ3_9BACL
MPKYAFRLLWTGQSLSALGDTLYIVALITLLYDATFSAAYTAMIPFLRCVANLVSGFLAPLAIEKFPLRKLLVYAQAFQTALLLSLTLVMVASSDSIAPPVVLAFVLLLSWLEAWILPAKNAIVPRLVDEHRLLKANSLLSMIEQSVRLAGWALGATLLVAIGARNVMWTTFALFAIATVAMAFIRERAEVVSAEGTLGDKAELKHGDDSERKLRDDAERKLEVGAERKFGEVAGDAVPAEKPKSVRQKLQEGWLVLWRIPALRVVSMLELFEGLAGGIFVGGVMLVYVKELLHRGEDWWGYINASYLLGAFVGGLFGIALSRWVDRRLGHTILYGSIGFSALTFSFAWIHLPIAALLLNFLMGPAFQLRDIAQRTLFQRSVEPGLLPQAFAAKGTLAYATFGISALLMAGLTDWLGVQSALTVSAVLYACCAIVAFLNKRLLFVASDLQA